jgi:ABC-type antimicrobial peptide transport system permease subunit
MATEHRRSKPTTSFTLTPRHIAYLEKVAADCQSNRSWVLGRIIDLFMSSPSNLIATNVTAITDEERVA